MAPPADLGDGGADLRTMPDSYGKRQRDQVKARKAAAKDERRVARIKRQREGPAPEPTFGEIPAIEPGEEPSATADEETAGTGDPPDQGA